MKGELEAYRDGSSLAALGLQEAAGRASSFEEGDAGNLGESSSGLTNLVLAGNLIDRMPGSWRVSAVGLHEL